MPPRRRSSSGYRGVRAHPNDTFYAEIRSGDERIGLDTFETAHEATRAYDAVAWRLGRSRRLMNFDDVMTRQQAEMLAPPPPAVKREQRQRELEQRLVIAERDERLRLEWAQQFPEDVAAMEAFYAEKAEEKAAAKAAKKADRKERRAKSTARKKEREEKAARKAARKKEEKKNGAGPSTIVVSSSSSFDWTSTPVSSTTLSSNFWDSLDEE
jgi:glucan-binding YG repeat protein